jgi:hypothetical protein
VFLSPCWCDGGGGVSFVTDDEALRQELLGFGPEGEAEGNTQADLDRGTHSEPAAAAAAEGLGAAGAAEELPPTETAAGLQVADDAAADQGDLAETSLAGGENIGGSDSDSDSDDSSSDSDSEEVMDFMTCAPLRRSGSADCDGNYRGGLPLLVDEIVAGD